MTSLHTCSHTEFLRRALEKSLESVQKGGFPAGAVIVKSGKVIGQGVSIGKILNDPTSHSEIEAIRSASKEFSSTNLSGSILYSSMQPCLMYLGAASWAGISEIVYACPMEKVSAEYYAGHYDCNAISRQLLPPIKLTHFKDLENESLAIVRQWELSL